MAAYLNPSVNPDQRGTPVGMQSSGPRGRALGMSLPTPTFRRADPEVRGGGGTGAFVPCFLRDACSPPAMLGSVTSTLGYEEARMPPSIDQPGPRRSLRTTARRSTRRLHSPGR